MQHLLWLWLWFFLGMVTYWLKRAYYLVTGPNPIANTYGQFVKRCWIPLVVRAFLDSIVFWLLFTPGVVDRVLAYFKWDNWAWAVSMITMFAPVAAIFGHTVDSGMDWLVASVFSKISWLKDWWPQMPGPLPSPPVALDLQETKG